MREREETSGAVRFDIDRHQSGSAKLVGREGENDPVGTDDLAIDTEMSREDITRCSWTANPPPSLASISTWFDTPPGVANSHVPTAFGSNQASNRRSGDAVKRRETTSIGRVRSAVRLIGIPLLQVLQISVEPVEARLPETPVILEPIRNIP
jgi:hypothetical protein